MDETRYIQVLDQYRTRSLDQLAEEVRALRRQIQDHTTTPSARRAAVERFGVAWHVYEEKGAIFRECFE